MKKHSGFTLLELLITLTIVGIVMAFAIPSMSEFIKNDRLTTQINTLVGHLAYARSEAVLRYQQVMLCPSSNQTSCSGTDWAAGWILFVDADGSSTFTTGDEILRAKQALTGNNTLVNSAASSGVIYDNRGFSPNTNSSFSLCDDRGASFIKSITISATGRVRKGGSVSCT